MRPAFVACKYGVAAATADRPSSPPDTAGTPLPQPHSSYPPTCHSIAHWLFIRTIKSLGHSGGFGVHVPCPLNDIIGRRNKGIDVTRAAAATGAYCLTTGGMTKDGFPDGLRPAEPRRVKGRIGV